MSKYLSERQKKLAPYTPGEQPKDKVFIKLNTNESPFPPSEKARLYAKNAAEKLMLYPDPECTELVEKMALTLGVSKKEILFTNGSDEILFYAFLAFCDENTPAVFPDITYGFYKVFASLCGVPTNIIPLSEDFSVQKEAYYHQNGTIFLANPNAPTGQKLSVEEIEEILKNNQDHVVVIDEAYVDFGNESVIPLIHKYENLLVTQTFSKSRSMAGARLGLGIACEGLIADLNKIKYATNPYNINRMTMAAGIGVLEDAEYTEKNCQTILCNRAFTEQELAKCGFILRPSHANFVFAKHPACDGARLYERLREKGILVRHFENARICEYVRITIGTKEQMEILTNKVKEILEEEL